MIVTYPAPDTHAAASASPRLHTNSQTLSLSFETSLIQSCMRLDAPEELVLDYTRAMMAFLLFKPEPASILMIGLGGGSMLKYLHRHLPQADITTVEINPAVIAMRQDFHIPPDDARMRIVQGDGARFVRQPPRRFDVILVDGFTGEGLPDVLCSRSFYQHCRAALAPQGMLVANVQADTAQARDILRRLGKAFAGAVLAFESDEGGNDIAVAGTDGVFAQALVDFDTQWQSLAAPHRAALAVASTRVQRAMMRSVRA